MNYRISIIDFINLNNFLKFLKKVKNSDGTKAPPPLLPPSGPRVPTGTSISPDLLVPVGEPGLMAQPNRDYR